MYKLFIITFLTILLIFGNSAKAQIVEGVAKYDTTLYLRHSPAKASLYSAALPGLGQIYNKKYWKIPIIYAGLGGLIYGFVYQNNQFEWYKEAYIIRYYNDPNQIEAFVSKNYSRFGGKTITDKIATYNNFTSAFYQGGMDKHRRYRDMIVMGIGILYVLNIIDATVDAYLMDYDISKDLSIHLRPNVYNSANSLNFALSCSIDF